MNERIKQLWKQAGGHYDSGNQHTWPQYTIDDPAKFAELIVRECAELANEETSLPYDSYSEKIKKHFGVEE
jgi:hypothetical protein